MFIFIIHSINRHDDYTLNNLESRKSINISQNEWKILYNCAYFWYILRLF